MRELLKHHGVWLRRDLGQNFVIDPNTIRKVVKLSGTQPTDRVLEIGAGAGSLTLALAAAAREVTAIEIDPSLEPVLNETVGHVANVRVLVGDVLEMDVGSFSADRMVSNLPYNVAASVVIKALEDAPSISNLTVMTQREVGERLAAGSGSKIYGQTSVLVAAHGTARIEANVSRQAFFPVPNVDSVVVSVQRHQAPPLDSADYPAFKTIVKAAFSQRRKTVRNTVGQALCERAGVEPSARAEELALEDFIALTRASA